MKVLYATDAFPSALDAGIALERWFDPNKVRVTVLSITHSGTLLPKHLLIQMDEQSQRRDDSVEIATTAAERLKELGFHATPQVGEGHAGREIVSAAERGKFDLIVIGAGSHSWVASHLLGSVSNYVVHNAHCSVMVVHEIDDGGDNSVLVAVDGSEHSRKTVGMLPRVLDARRCRIEIISVAGTLAPVVAAVPGAVATLPLNEKDQDAILRWCEGAVVAAADPLKEAGFDVATRVVAGSPASTIVDEAMTRGFDLVALGARGHGSLVSAVLGSVSDLVVRRSRAALVAR